LFFTQVSLSFVNVPPPSRDFSLPFFFLTSIGGGAGFLPSVGEFSVEWSDVSLVFWLRFLHQPFPVGFTSLCQLVSPLPSIFHSSLLVTPDALVVAKSFSLWPRLSHPFSHCRLLPGSWCVASSPFLLSSFSFFFFLFERPINSAPEHLQYSLCHGCLFFFDHFYVFVLNAECTPPFSFCRPRFSFPVPVLMSLHTLIPRSRFFVPLLSDPPLTHGSFFGPRHPHPFLTGQTFRPSIWFPH